MVEARSLFYYLKKNQARSLYLKLALVRAERTKTDIVIRVDSSMLDWSRSEMEFQLWSHRLLSPRSLVVHWLPPLSTPSSEDFFLLMAVGQCEFRLTCASVGTLHESFWVTLLQISETSSLKIAFLSCLLVYFMQGCWAPIIYYNKGYSCDLRAYVHLFSENGVARVSYRKHIY